MTTTCEAKDEGSRAAAEGGPTSPDGAAGDWRSSCPIGRTLDIIGDRWSLLVVRDLLYCESCTFKKLSASPERIPTNTLTDRLRKLEAAGLVERRVYQRRPVRHDYALTPRGKALAPVLRQLALYGLGGDESAFAHWARMVKERAVDDRGGEEKEEAERRG